MLKIISVVGARPQFIKAAVISRALKKHSIVKEVIVHTGQHFDENMSDVFFDEMEIPRPQYNLNINSLSHGAMTGKMILALEELFLLEKPNFVIVFGDTNSTLAAAIAAKKLQIKLVHVEAGVRNFDNTMPEEINRILVDRIADFNFPCTHLSYENLEREGYLGPNIDSVVQNVGDVMYDAALYYGAKSREKSPILSDLGLRPGNYILSTVHRAENTDVKTSLTNINSFFNNISSKLTVILPIHPRTKKKMDQFGLNPSYKTIEPVGYFSMLELIKNAKYVITDSGGVVREAYFFKKPSLLLYEKPVWPELVSGGYCISSSTEPNDLSMSFKKMKQVNLNFDNSLFGLGNAGDLIVATLLNEHLC